MNKKIKRLATLCAAFSVVGSGIAMPGTGGVKTASAASQYTLEYLDRGISAVNTGSGMLVSWRWLANDSDSAVFKLYRDNTLIYTSESGKSTCYLDKSGNASSQYRVDTLSGSTVVSSEKCKLISGNNYFDVPLSPPAAQTSGTVYTPNDMSVGDVDGDGQYELFLKWDPSNSKDNSQKGKTDKVYIDCVRLDGTRLWRIDLGCNIRAGAHYTQFYVADFDLDGKCEMACKTADGTVDGAGKMIGDGSKDYRNSDGYVLSGNEYYTLFDGATGAALHTVNYEPARGTVSSWGDKYGNRVDRFWGTVAYLDGVHPCIVTGRGYYTRMTATAYKVENKKLVKMWNFDTGNNSSAAGYGDGNHNSMPVDADGDGRQEVFTGATIIDDNGTVYYNTNQGHGDAMHVGDLDPTNPGMEAWICHEDKGCGYGVSLLDLDQKKILYHQNGASDTGRCCADNVWAGNPGAECWGNKTSDGSTPVVDTKGNVLNCRRPAINFLSYWDGDLEREILDGYTDSPATISKMTGNSGSTTITNLLVTDGFYTCNTTKGTPCLSADIFGDWREELIVRAANHKSVRIYCTTYDTDYRITTLMHDPQYRMQVSAQNTAYNQPPHTRYFLGTGYDLPARPTDCTVNGVKPGKVGSSFDTKYKYTIKNAGSGLYLEVADGIAADGTNVQQGENGNGWYLVDCGDGYYKVISELGGGKTYYLDVDYGKTENGTNIGIWSDTDSDAQSFKFVDNGDGTYAICTKVTTDASGIGVAAASTESGANVIEWACNESADQKWIIEPKLDPVKGKLISDIKVLDTTYYNSWSVDESLETGDKVFGDREIERSAFNEIPDAYKNAEFVLTPCDSKFSDKDQAVITAGEDITLYVGFDTRLEVIPEWAAGFTKTSDSLTTTNDVTFNLYSKNVSKGESVTFGANGQSSYVVNYIILAKEAVSEAVLPGDTDTDGRITVFDIVTMRGFITGDIVLEGEALANADVNSDGERNTADLVQLESYLLGKIKHFG